VKGISRDKLCVNNYKFLTAMLKKKNSRFGVAPYKNDPIGFENNLEQLSHIAIVSFIKGTDI